MNKQDVLIGSVLGLFLLTAAMVAAPFAIGPVQQFIAEVQATKLPVDDPDFLYARAEEYYRAGELGMAHDVANRAVIVAPKYARAHKLLAAIYLKNKNYPEALKASEAAAQLDPTDPNAQLGIGSSLKEMGRTDEAEKIYQKLLKSDTASDEHRELAEQMIRQISEKALSAKPTRAGSRP